MKAYLRAAMAAVCCAVAAGPAMAVVPITYTFDLYGVGYTQGMTQASPSVYYFSDFYDARVSITVADVTGRSYSSSSTSTGGIAEIFSTTGGLGFRFQNNNGFAYGGACFSNPGGLFPTGPVALVTGGGCGEVIYTQLFAGQRDDFKGVVTALRVTDAPAGSSGGAGITNLAAPEPTTWLMMIVGFGAIGFGTRARRATARSS